MEVDFVYAQAIFTTKNISYAADVLMRPGISPTS